MNQKPKIKIVRDKTLAPIANDASQSKQKSPIMTVLGYILLSLILMAGVALLSVGALFGFCLLVLSQH